MVKTISFNLVQSPQPYLPLHKKFLMLFDLIQQRSSKISFLPPKVLLTKNRKDIEYRVEFLRNVIDNGLSPQQTLYYNFISDNDKGVILDVESVSKDFISLYNDIKKNGIKQPIPVGKYDEKIIKVRYILKGKKYWEDFVNEIGYQILGGGHRLAVAIYLNHKTVPVKIFKPSLLYEITNQSAYLELKENEYLKKIKNNNENSNA